MPTTELDPSSPGDDSPGPSSAMLGGGRATMWSHRPHIHVDVFGDAQRVAAGRRPVGQRGYVLVWMALLLVVLVGFAGFGVDTANLWFVGQKMQKAADAAALAGVVFLPGNLESGISQAQAVAAQNGYTNGVNSVVVTANQDPTNPNRLDVEITYTSPTLFVGVLGVKSLTLHRYAVAEYEGPVPMGSPTNNLGDQPTVPGSGVWTAGSSLTAAEQTANTDPQLWANIAGPQTSKDNGDRFSTAYCATTGTYYNCNGSANTEPQVVNSDGTYGYYYAVQIVVGTAQLGQRLDIQVYDPAFVQSGDTCTAFSATTSGGLVSGSDTSNESTFEAALHTDAGTAHPNWDPQNANAASYCTGDNFIRAGYPAPTTYFQVEQPDLTPWNDGDNPPVNDTTYCNEANTYQASRSTTLPEGTFPPIAGDVSTDSVSSPTNGSMGPLSTLLNSSTGGWEAQYAQLVYHNYITVCNASMSDLGITTAGTYKVILRVRTNAGSAGHNRFAIRAGFVSDTSGDNPTGSGVSVFADGKLPIYMNASGANTLFYIAQILPNNADRTLEIDLFDVGDVALGTDYGTIQLLPPTDATDNGSTLSTFSGCTFSRLPEAMPSSYATASTCSLADVNASNGFNGQLVVVTVPIPAGYSCDSSDPFGCWVRVSFQYAAGGAITDTTTWTANLQGDPVRLVS